ncbi:MAG TPA: DUF2188 domain-containing protein [Ignavibacteriaceae bacterium]|nr:DUF2188 domain-containing protein [Ignavibacteriaceae bacterium]
MATQFIMPFEGKWAVKGEHSQDITSVHDTREEAIEVAKEIAMADDSGIVILREDGTIDNLGAYGIDPLPSKDNIPDFNDENDEGV